ncbi:MAG: hypothetical protein ACE5L6_00255 [Candidatus Bathyarchaeia archaeon]
MDGVSGLRGGVVLLLLFVLLWSGFVFGVGAVDEEGAVSAVEGAEGNVVEAYGVVLEAEKAGANVSSLLDRLDVAAEYLAVAWMCLRLGDSDGAVGNASLCVEALDGIAGDAAVLREKAIKERGERNWITISGSVVGVVLVLCGSWFGWASFKKRYYRRVLEMKPEVAEGES